jgi:AraC family transcriptional regulator
MQSLEVAGLAPTSAGAFVAKGSDGVPDLLFASNGDAPLMAARWRVRHVDLKRPPCLDEHILTCCAAGRADGTLTVDGHRRRLPQRTGTLAFLPADCPVPWVMTASGEQLCVHLYVPAAIMRAAGAPAASATATSLPTRLHDPWLEGYFRLMMADIDAWGAAGLEGSRFLDETHALLVAHLSSALRRVPRPATAPRCPAARPVSALRPFILRKVASHVDSQLADNIPLEALARMAGLSVGHFVRAFHAATGSTPHRYVLRRRLDRACDLLTNTTDPVSDVALRCGFSSPAHFASAFHKHQGCTPSQFRRRH